MDNRSVATVVCPLDGSVFERTTYAGKVCETCQLTKLGEAALGLNILLEGQQPQKEDLFL